MSGLKNVTHLRVRYSETGQMGTFYNSRALERFGCGRTVRAVTDAGGKPIRPPAWFAQALDAARSAE